MNPELQRQFNRINNFNENESIKMIEIKKLLTSKLFFVFIITCFVLVGSLFIANFVNQLLSYDQITFGIVFSLIGDGILNLIFPAVFIFFILTIRKRALANNLSMRDGLLTKLVNLRSFVKFFFIINIIVNISNGITYSRIDFLYEINPELYTQLVGSTNDIAIFKVIGLYFLIQGGFSTCIWFALSRITKQFLHSILLDTTDSKFNDAFVFVAFFILQAVLEVVGLIISLCGITNPLTSIYFVPPIIFTDLLFLIYAIINLIFALFLSFIFLKLRKILITNKGTTNPLNDEDSIVYTIDID